MYRASLTPIFIFLEHEPLDKKVVDGQVYKQSLFLIKHLFTSIWPAYYYHENTLVHAYTMYIYSDGLKQYNCFIELFYKRIFPSSVPEEVWRVDLDSGRIHAPSRQAMEDIPPLPEPEGRTLKSHLKQVKVCFLFLASLHLKYLNN